MVLYILQMLDVFNKTTDDQTIYEIFLVIANVHRQVTKNETDDCVPRGVAFTIKEEPYRVVVYYGPVIIHKGETEDFRGSLKINFNNSLQGTRIQHTEEKPQSPELSALKKHGEFEEFSLPLAPIFALIQTSSR